jgi:hypothetical protein
MLCHLDGTVQKAQDIWVCASAMYVNVFNVLVTKAEQNVRHVRNIEWKS